MSRKVLFEANGWNDYLHWQSEDRSTLRKINKLIEDIRRGGNADGIGKPEPLRENLAGWWSRRITKEHRLVYHADEDTVVIISCRFHYDS